MVTIRITSIEPLSAAGTWLTGASIDLPRVDEPHDGHFLTVAGWVVGRCSPVKTVEILHDGHWLTGVPVLLVRPDVSRHLDLADHDLPTGFEVAFNTVGLQETFAVSVWAYLEGEAPPVEFAILRGTRSRLRSSFRPALQPLSVTSLGRCGTTLVMQTLAEHPEVCVQRHFPFETRIAAYWMHVLTVLGGPANHHESSHPDTFLNERLFVGNNPYAQAGLQAGPALRAWLQGEGLEDLAAFCQRNIDAAYLRIARDQGQASVRFFAEKTPPTYGPRLLGHLYEGAREIILVRDFRDMVSSMMAFDTKRGRRDFQRDDAPEDFVLRLADDYRRLVGTWEERRNSAMLLRYEDLIAEPRETLRRLTTYAGIDTSPAAIDRMVAGGEESESTRAHRTTEDGARSIGRYRRDMNEETLDLCREVCGDLLTTLGYSH